MKLALVTAFPPSKGSLNEYGFHLTREFLANPKVDELVIIGDRLESEFEETVIHDKLTVSRVWDFNTPSSLFKILRSLHRQKVDGVVFNLQTATFGDQEIPAALGLFTPLIARLCGIRSGVLAHNLIEAIDLENTILKGNRFRQSLVKCGGWATSWAMANASYVTTTLDIYADLLRKRFPRADIHMVPHGTFERPDIKLPSIWKRPNRIVTMGKFGTYKKLDTLLAAFERLVEKDETLELIIGGEDHPNTPGYMKSIKTRYRHLKSVVFAGYIPEEAVSEFFANARLAVFDYEATTGSSGVLHQCASFGAVPVFPRIGDFVELCEREGMDGFHYSPGSASEMELAIRSALSDVDELVEVSENNLQASAEMPLSEVAEFHVNKLLEQKKADRAEMPAFSV